jgi:hypothetical protein
MLGFTLALIAGLLYPFGKHLVDTGGLLKKGKNFGNDNCQIIQRRLMYLLAV